MKPIGVLWDEAIKGRAAEDVASTFVAFIRNFRDCEKFVFQADNCSGQNKNWFLYTALVNEANRLNGGVKEIILNYFEPGHTLMSADSFHHKVEQAMEKKKGQKISKILSNWLILVGSPSLCDSATFFDFPRGVSNGKYAEAKPKLEDVFVVKFERGSDRVFGKTRHTEEHFKSSQLLQKKLIRNLGTNFPTTKQPRGVPTSKKEGIVQKLTPF